jgi:hypothetical protein
MFCCTSLVPDRLSVGLAGGGVGNGPCYPPLKGLRKSRGAENPRHIINIDFGDAVYAEQQS